MGINRREVIKGAAGLAAVSMAPNLLASRRTNQSMLKSLANEPLQSFAFGSCNDPARYGQSYWRTIYADDPKLWIWMGDNIYADGLTMAQRVSSYGRLKADRYYSDFRSGTPVIGTWDDHDFRSNNKDGEWTDKEQSKLAAMAFLDMDAAKVEGHSGIYQSYTFGPEGKRTKVILLDLRFNMVQQKGRPYDLLGDEQWPWLQDELFLSDYELLIIGSSQNVLATNGPQSWAAFPKEQELLFQLMTEIPCPVLFLSGDRHHGDFSRGDLKGEKGDKTVYEFMSSGLTHSNPIGRSNPRRIGQSVRQKNYGLINIDWDGSTPKLELLLKSPSNGKVLQQTTI